MRSTHLPFLCLSPNLSFMNQKYKKRKKGETKNNNTLSSTRAQMSDINKSNFLNSSSRLFNTQIMMSTSYNSANSKRTKHLIQVNKIKVLKQKIRDSCNVLDKKCIHLNSDINKNPIMTESNYINRTSNAIKDVTMKSIKDEITHLGKEIDKKGMFVTISDSKGKVAKGEDPNKMTKIFISENPNNIFNRTLLAEKMNPISVLKFKKKVNNVFNLNLKLDRTKNNKINPYFKFLKAYNREYAYTKKVSEHYNIKTNDKATYLFTL